VPQGVVPVVRDRLLALRRPGAAAVVPAGDAAEAGR